MSVVDGLRHSGVSRLGLQALIVLAYLVYVGGLLLERLDRLVADFPLVPVVAATVLVLVGLKLAEWFFVTEPAALEADEPDDTDGVF